MEMKDQRAKKKPTVRKYPKYARRPSDFEWGEWETSARRSPNVDLKEIGPFDSRGMHHVYGRAEDYTGEGYSRKHTVNMDIWLTIDGRMLARFWSLSDEVDWLSYEVIGLPLKVLLSRKRNLENELDEKWAPWCLRSAYSNWIDQHIGYI
jgi:hypothetical protein